MKILVKKINILKLGFLLIVLFFFVPAVLLNYFIRLNKVINEAYASDDTKIKNQLDVAVENKSPSRSLPPCPIYFNLNKDYRPIKQILNEQELYDVLFNLKLKNGKWRPLTNDCVPLTKLAIIIPYKNRLLFCSTFNK